jgi:hypothetical protein
MTEKLMCSNCGAPVTRTGTDTSVACPHCQTVTEFPPVASASRSSGSSGGGGGSGGSRRSRDDDDDDDDDDDRGGHIPNIVIIQAPAAAPAPQQIVLGPRIIQSGPVYVRRQRSLASMLIGPIVFLVIFVAVGAFIRAKVSREIPAAERAIKEAEKAAKKR